MLTDAEFFDSPSFDQYLPHAQFSVIGVGSKSGGYMVQGYDANGYPRYHYFDGERAVSRVSPETVYTLA